MNLAEKERLARLNDMGQAACAIRLRAAIILIGKQQKDVAREAGISTTVLNNAVVGASFPNRELMRYLYRAHRLDFNFMLNGDFAQLPGDVQDALWPALEAANSAWDRKEG